MPAPWCPQSSVAVALVRLRRWILPLAVVVFQLGVNSALAVALVAITVGVSFALAGDLIPALATGQLLQLFTLLSSESLGVLLTLLMFLIRALLPVSLVVHLQGRWPAGRLRLSEAQVMVGAALAAAVLFLHYQLFSLVALAYVSDGWLDPVDLAPVLQMLQPTVLLCSCARVAMFALLACLAVLRRWWPLQPLPAPQPPADEPFDPWRPSRKLPLGHLTMIYSDLFRLLVLLVPLELGYQLSSLPGSLSA